MKEKVLDELYNQYYNQLVLWADSILKDMNAAEDLVQNLFVRLWEKKLVEQIRPETAKAYLYTSVRNMAVKEYKEKVKEETIPDRTIFEQTWGDDETNNHEEIIRRILQEMEKLPPRTREVLECIHLKNMKYIEVADHLNISVATVKTLLVRSLKSIREQISDINIFLYLLYKNCEWRNKKTTLYL